MDKRENTIAAMVLPNLTWARSGPVRSIYEVGAVVMCPHIQYYPIRAVLMLHILSGPGYNSFYISSNDTVQTADLCRFLHRV